MTSKSFLPFAYLQGKFLPFAEANISIATHALHYGTGAFGGMRSVPDTTRDNTMLLFRPDLHAARLSQSARYLGYDISAEKIHSLVREFIIQNKPKNPIYIRPLVYTSDLDLSPRLHDIEMDILLYGLELGDYLSSEGIRCTVSSWARQQDNSFPLRGKITGGYITSALAKTEAKNRGFDDAILMNASGKVSEWSAMNIFLVKEGIISTPSTTQDILEGITRRSVIELARSMGYEVQERSIDKTELFSADEVFFTGTAARITPARAIEQYDLPEKHPVTDILKTRLDTIVIGQDPEFINWIEQVSW